MAGVPNLAQQVLQLLAESGEARASLAPHQNYRDYLNLRHVNRITLHVSFAVPQRNPPAGAPFTGQMDNRRAAVAAPAQPAAGGQNVPPTATHGFNPPMPYFPRPTPIVPRTIPTTIPPTLQMQLGALTCNDTIGSYHGVTIPPGAVPCPNRLPTAWGPGTAPVRFCQATHPQTHEPSPPDTFRVCRTCQQANWHNRAQMVWVDLEQRRAICCKRCSQRIKSQHPNSTPAHPFDGCTCRATMAVNWLCFDCMNMNERWTLTYGSFRLERLKRSHKVRDRKAGRKKIVVRWDDSSPRNRNVRTHAACPMPGCAERASTRKPTDPMVGLSTWAKRDAATM